MQGKFPLPCPAPHAYLAEGNSGYFYPVRRHLPTLVVFTSAYARLSLRSTAKLPHVGQHQRTKQPTHTRLA
jgi:hypothetical protein